MVCSCTPQSVTDELAFPIWVKVLVPGDGLRRLLDDVLVWLDREVGRADYAQHTAMTLGGIGVGFHFRDAEAVCRFLEAFPDLTLADGTATAAYTSPALPHGGDRRPGLTPAAPRPSTARPSPKRRSPALGLAHAETAGDWA